MNLDGKKYFLAAVLATCLCLSGEAGQRMALGANVNEDGVALEQSLLDESQTKYVRAFFPASQFITGRRNLKNDDDLLALNQAARSGQHVILCLKWDFEKAGWRVPAPDSEMEKKCFAWVDTLLAEMGDKVFALETVNEVTVDTLPEDMLPGSGGEIPMVRFLQRLVAHLHANTDVPPLFSGGFTQLELIRMQKNPGVEALLDWIESDPRVTGANFHIHEKEFNGFKEYLKYIRSKIPKKPYIVSEFSMVWKYKANLSNPIASDSKSQAFAETYRLDGDTTILEYINRAIEHPVPEKQWNDFLESQEWYDSGFLKKACIVMERYGVVLATFAFQQGSSGGRLLEPDSTPWILNPIFLNKTACGRSGKAVARSVFFNDYVAWQKTGSNVQLVQDQ